MATLVNHLLAKVTFESASGIPADRVVNTFHFQRLGSNSLGTDTGNINTYLQAFYNTAPTAVVDASTAVLSSFLSPTISRSANSAKIDIYDMSVAAPRVPIFTANFTPAAAGGTGGLPNEVALCLSYRSQTIGVPLNRQRGRVFFGPLVGGTTVLNSSPSGGDFQPPTSANAIVDTLVACGSRLIELSKPTGTGNGPAWCVYSTVNNALYRATAHYVDTAFDTQRRRGAKPPTRVNGLPSVS